MHGHGMTFVGANYVKECGIGKRKTFLFQTHKPLSYTKKGLLS